MAKRILLTDKIREIGVDYFKKAGMEVVLAPDPKPETILSMAADFDGMVSRNTFIGKDIFDKAPRLRAVASHGVGTDHIDLKEATKHKVYVVNTPGANSHGVAEMALGFMLALSHRIKDGDIAICRNGDYYARNGMIGHNLEGKTLGIVGLGNIGRHLAKLCKTAFSMRVLAYSPSVPDKTFAELGLEKAADVAQICKECDYISLNCSYTENKLHMINEAMFKLMKPTAYLVNCARGQLVDQKALYEALKNGRLAGAATDVYETEPPVTKGEPIYQLPNFIATPHIATNSEDSINNLALISAMDVVSVLNGEPQKAHVANKDILAAK